MQQIMNITNEPKQSFVIPLSNGGSFILSIEYINSQIGWFFDIQSENGNTYCRRITNCPNLLRDKQNILKFSLSCYIDDNSEPYFVDDFISGRAKLYVLNEEDIKYIGRTQYGKIF